MKLFPFLSRYFVLSLIGFLSGLFSKPVFSQSIIPDLREITGTIPVRLNTLPENIICNHKDLLVDVEILNDYLINAGCKPFRLVSNEQSAVVLKLDPKMPSGQYRMEWANGNLSISGSHNGIFYGLMTLLQYQVKAKDGITLPGKSFTDAPAFAWRGMHLDVSRHFFPPSFVKKYIDLLAMHKMNTFHWHLTDDQGWRIEIKKYPLLTEIGSKRHETMVDKNFEPYIGDGKPVEGFYTQAEVREIVEYAAKRHITVVPEIEMPGHAMAALSAYPAYSCFRSSVDVMTKWGVSEDVFCTKDSTLRFLKDILDEVMGLFPSKFIHIGGDEVPKSRWKLCANCQSNMQKHGLKDEHELQSYFIRQIDQYLTSKGRNCIGWDEILEGGLAPKAAVMSWRGEEGGIAAARAGHQVVMSPGSHCYFDHYQGNRQTEPLAIGGYTTLERVYSYYPVPDSLNDREAKFVMGAQGNVWTEYMGSPEHVEYMVLPRLCALAEVLWCGKQKPSYDRFKNRLLDHFTFLEKLNFNYSKAVFSVESKVYKRPDHLVMYLFPPFPEGEIRYTVDGKDVDIQSEKYNINDSLSINKSILVKAKFYQNSQAKGPQLSEAFEFNPACLAQISSNIPPNKHYNLGGIEKLIDARIGKTPMVGSEWLGWSGKNPIIQMGWSKTPQAKKIGISLLKQEESWIYLPEEIDLEWSNDDDNYQSMAKADKSTLDGQYVQNQLFEWELPNEPFRFIRISFRSMKSIPDGKPGAGQDPWLFLSEIILKD
jgi:hexosaminidase